MQFLAENIFWIVLILSIVFIFAYKKFSKNPDAITSKFESKIIINGNLNDHLLLIGEALKNAGFKEIKFDDVHHRFYAQTKFSMYSFSEHIEVSFSETSYPAELNFKSICALPTQVIDWGKNKSNFQKFKKELEKLMPFSSITTAT